MAKVLRVRQEKVLFSLDLKFLSCENIGVIDNLELSAENVDNRADVKVLDGDLGVGGPLEEGLLVLNVPLRMSNEKREKIGEFWVPCQ